MHFEVTLSKILAVLRKNGKKLVSFLKKERACQPLVLNKFLEPFFSVPWYFSLKNHKISKNVTESLKPSTVFSFDLWICPLNRAVGRSENPGVPVVIRWE